MKANDLFENVTNQIIEQIEAGNLPVWQKNWNGYGSVPLRHDKTMYSGGNIIALWIASMNKGYVQPIWMTFKQAQTLGGVVKKGEKSSRVYYYDRAEKEDKETGEKIAFAFAKCYAVFNVQQIEGLPERYFSDIVVFKNPDLQDDDIQSFINSTGANINHWRGMGNFYAPAADQITLEPFVEFKNAHAYYTTAFHELVHWTGAKSRLDREQKGKKYSSEYAFEELVAELGAAFLAAHFGLSNEPRKDHAAYLNNWLTAFKNDKQFLFKAASQASQAVQFLLGKGIKEQEVA